MFMTSLAALFEERTNASYARWARILVGSAALLVGLDQWLILERVLDPEYIDLPYAPLIPQLPADQLPVLMGIWFAAAITFIAGRFVYIPGALLIGVMSYAIGVDQQAFSNHLYLLILLTALVTVAESTASDTGIERTVAAWPLLLMKLQLTIVYGYSVLFKLNPVFLSGDMIDQYLRTDGPLTVPTALQTPEMLRALAIMTLCIEAFLAVAFWIPGLRRPALVLGLGFHFALVWTMQVDFVFALTAFGLEMAAMYVMFVHLPSPATVPRRLPIALPGMTR